MSEEEKTTLRQNYNERSVLWRPNNGGNVLGHYFDDTYDRSGRNGMTYPLEPEGKNVSLESYFANLKSDDIFCYKDYPSGRYSYVVKDFCLNKETTVLSVATTNEGGMKSFLTSMRIYYRNDAIRIEVKPETNQYGEYEALVHDKLVYQKGSASPYATNNLYAFFVDKENIETVLVRLIESDSIPTEEQIADYTANSQHYKAEKKKAGDQHRGH